MPSPEGSSVLFRRSHEDVRPRAIEVFARTLQKEVARGRPFDCLITGDAELRRLNREFLGTGHATDVLSFPLWGRQSCLPPPFRRRLGCGDLAISVPRARAQARQFGHTTEQEIRILMLHGLLHLLGMDHDADGGRMARAERRWRARLGLPNGLIERVQS